MAEIQELDSLIDHWCLTSATPRYLQIAYICHCSGSLFCWSNNSQKSEWTVFTMPRVAEELAKFPNELSVSYTPVLRNFPKNLVKMKLKNCSKCYLPSCSRQNNCFIMNQCQLEPIKFLRVLLSYLHWSCQRRFEDFEHCLKQRWF